MRIQKLNRTDTKEAGLLATPIGMLFRDAARTSIICSSADRAFIRIGTAREHCERFVREFAAVPSKGEALSVVRLFVRSVGRSVGLLVGWLVGV